MPTTIFTPQMLRNGTRAVPEIPAGGGGGFPNTYSMDFDGVDDYVQAKLVDGDSIIAGSKTISWWMKLDQYNTTEMIMSIRGTSGADYFSVSKTSSGVVSFGCRGAVTHGRSADTTKYDVTTLTDWTHFLVTKKLGSFGRGEIVKIFINGVDVTGGLATVNGGSANEIKIGQIGNIGYMGSLLHGSVDELAVFDGHLDSPAEVTSIYNGGIPTDLTDKNPLVWYRMGDNGAYKSPQWLLPNNENKDKLSNYSFEFDGVDDYVDTGIPNLSGTDFSISYWFKTTATFTNFTYYVPFSAVSNQAFVGAFLYNRPTELVVICKNSSGAIPRGTTNLKDGNWHHIASTYNETTKNFKTYVDGSLELDETIFSYTIFNQPLLLGGKTPSLYLIDCSIDEAAYWDSELTSINITDIYNSGTPTTLPSGAVAHYRMGEDATFSTNWTVPDQVGSNDGTSANMTIEDRVGTAPSSSNNALSFNMDLVDRVEDVPS